MRIRWFAIHSSRGRDSSWEHSLVPGRLPSRQRISPRRTTSNRRDGGILGSSCGSTCWKPEQQVVYHVRGRKRPQVEKKLTHLTPTRTGQAACLVCGLPSPCLYKLYQNRASFFVGMMVDLASVNTVPPPNFGWLICKIFNILMLLESLHKRAL